MGGDSGSPKWHMKWGIRLGGPKPIGRKEKIFPITATFIGRDGSCGFKNGKEYELWMILKNNKIYISRRKLGCIAIPYDTRIALEKNWKIKENYICDGTN